MKRKKSLITLGKSPYDAPQCFCFSISVESSILTGSNFTVNTEKFDVEEDNDWM